MNKREEIVAAMEEGLVFRKAAPRASASSVKKVRTKAKKKKYITGLHGSDSAKKKADIRKRRANRHAH